MTRKKIDDDDDEFDDSILDDLEPNEDNVESALQTRDYSARKILVWVNAADLRSSIQEILLELLTGANIRVVGDEPEALRVLNEDEWDTFVVDFTEPDVSTGDFVKFVNNQENAMLIAIHYTNLLSEERNRFKLEPLRKLFDVEKPKPKPVTLP